MYKACSATITLSGKDNRRWKNAFCHWYALLIISVNCRLVQLDIVAQDGKQVVNYRHFARHLEFFDVANLLEHAVSENRLA